ncbi:MAG: DUF805 domain-containing protein [Rhodobacteraceae bacterium]|nr:DUF805 domain-containing protein [Paracoccaceae bacterium]
MTDGAFYMHVSGWLFMAFWAIVIVAPFYALWRRTGHSGWLALLMLVPVVNLIMLYVLAFKRWPVEDGARRDG